MTEEDELLALMEETAKLEHELRLLKDTVPPEKTVEAWMEVQKRDLRDSQLRQQNMLQSHIRHLRQVIHERY